MSFIDIQLSATELAQRGVPYEPIRPVPDVYTHVGAAKNYRTGRRVGIRMIVDHTTEVDGTMTGALRYDARRSDLVSCTAFVDDDGIGYDVDERNTPFTNGRWNDEALTCETVGKAAWSAVQWMTHELLIVNKVALFTDWCRRFSIPPRWLSADEIVEGASRHGTTPVAGVQRGITDHLEANRAAIELGADRTKYTHSDVGDGMRFVLQDHIIPAVARALAPTNPDTPLPEDPMTIASDHYIVRCNPKENPALWIAVEVHGNTVAHVGDGDLYRWLVGENGGWAHLSPPTLGVPQFVTDDLGRIRRICNSKKRVGYMPDARLADIWAANDGD